MTNIYTPEGWLNVPALADLPAWLRVIIGKRQVGKTYGTLKYMIESGRRFILLRCFIRRRFRLWLPESLLGLLVRCLFLRDTWRLLVENRRLKMMKMRMA